LYAVFHIMRKDSMRLENKKKDKKYLLAGQVR